MVIGPRGVRTALPLLACLLVGRAISAAVDLTIGGGSVIPVVTVPGETLGVRFNVTSAPTAVDDATNARFPEGIPY